MKRRQEATRNQDELTALDRIKIDLALSLNDGTPPDSISLATDLPRIFTTRQRAVAYLIRMNVAVRRAEEIVNDAFDK